MRNRSDQPIHELAPGEQDKIDGIGAPVVGSTTDTTETTETTRAAAGSSSDFKIAELRDDGTNITEFVLQTEDGRMFTAAPAEGQTFGKHDVIKSSDVTISHEGIEDGVPTKATVTSVTR